MNAVIIENLTLGFKEKPILRSFSATVKAGEFIGIFGPNGAGKSTLLRALLGLIKPLEGNIRILEKPCRRGNPGIGYLSQFRQYASSNALSADAYLASACRGFRWGWPHLNKMQRVEIERVIALTGLHDFIARPYLQLSGGERQRVALAQALLGQPKILLLDEPLSGLDPGQQEKMVRLIQTIQQQMNITVLFTAHDMNPLLGAMNRIIYLAHGKAAVGTIEQVVNSETLSWLYDAPIQVIHHGELMLVIHEKLGTSIHAHDHRDF